MNPTEPLAPLAATIVGLVIAVVGIVVGFGVLGHEAAQIICSSAGTIIGAVFVIVNEIRHRTITMARAIEAGHK
jgi:hypothetical protein